MTPAPPQPRVLTTEPSVKQVTSDEGRFVRNEEAAARRAEEKRENEEQENKRESTERREEDSQGGKGEIRSR